MTHFWKWLGVSTLWAAVLYGGLIVLSAQQIPWRSPHFDSAAPTTTQPGWGNEARYFMLNKPVFDTLDDRVLILGASNARDPFRPDIMEADLAGWKVANASLSGAGIGEIADAVDLYYQERGDAPGRTVVVVSLNYIQFLPSPYDAAHDNPLATEARRGGLHERHDGLLTPRYPRLVERTARVLNRPQVVAASLPRRLFRVIFVNPRLPVIKSAADRLRSDDPLAQWIEYIGEHPNRDAITVPPDMQRALMAQRLADAGGDKPLPRQGFETLSRLIDEVDAHGDRLVILDLPLPDWHFAGVPQTDQSYRDGITELLAAHTDADVSLISLRDFNAAENFFDSGHTKPRLWPVLSHALAARLKPVLDQDGPPAER